MTRSPDHPMIRFKSRPGLVAYITCGDPDLATSREVILAAIDAGADVIELGVPFSDPLADGPIIQRASQRAIEAGTGLGDVLLLAAEVRRRRKDAGLIIFSYLNPILRYGLEMFCEEANAAGINGVLVTDLTLEEAGVYRSLMKMHELATIFLAAPTSTDARLQKIADASQGFIYAVARTGVTGPTQGGNVTEDAANLVKRIRKVSTLPVAVGFGISTPQDFQSVSKFADAAVVGSAIVSIIEQSVKSGQSATQAAEAVSKWIKSLRASADGKLQAGAI
jgi:tryptophan synthase alpha chain